MSELRIKAKVIKRKDIRQDYQKSFKKAFAEEGEIFNGYFSTWPEIGGNFTFWEFKSEVDLFFPFTTSSITEMIDNRTFKTKNSIYELITLVDERDEKIDILIN